MTIEFGFHTIDAEVVSEFADRVEGRTWPSQGSLGGQAVIALAKANPKTIVLLGRNKENINPVIEAARKNGPEVDFRFVHLDLSSQNSVRKAATDLNSSLDKIDVLINSGGIMAPPYRKTEEGLESQFGVNHIAHFLLTNLLMSKILAPGSASRVVNISSSGHWLSPIRFDDYNFQDGKTYTQWEGYGQGKTGNVLLSKSLATKLADKGLFAFSLHPGTISTNLGSELNEALLNDLKERFTKAGVQHYGVFQYKKLEEGTSTMLRAALDPSLESENGAFLEDCKVAEAAPWATDSEAAEKLWKLSEEIVGQTFDY